MIMLNKKGFAISVVMYSIVFLLVTIFYVMLGILRTRYNVSNDLRSFSRHFAVFEDDFSRKVDVLFQNYDTDFNEHKIFKKDIDSLKDDSFKYGVQIEHL